MTEEIEQILIKKDLFEKFELPTNINANTFIKTAEQLGCLVAKDENNKLYIYGIDPQIERKDTDNEEVYNHPSYGTVSLSRITSTGTKLFCSSLNHENLISLRIDQTEMINTNLHDTHCFPKEKIIEVGLTASQFAELITTLNYGSGTPCTIFYKESTGSIPYREPESLKPADELNKMQEKAEKDNDETINNIYHNARRILDKNSISKKDRQELLSSFKYLIDNNEQKFQFMQSQFQKKMEKYIAEAKTEIDSTLTNMVLNKDSNQKELE